MGVEGLGYLLGASRESRKILHSDDVRTIQGVIITWLYKDDVRIVQEF